MGGGFDRLAAPARLLADGFVERDAAVGEGYRANDEGEGVVSGGISIGLDAWFGMANILTRGSESDIQCVLILVIELLAHLLHTRDGMLARLLAGLEISSRMDSHLHPSCCSHA